MMILDTNVLSELMARRPRRDVLMWADAQRRGNLVTTSINVMELYAGLQLMGPSKRRIELASMIDWALDDLLAGRVMNFDRRAAIAAAALYAKRRAAGRAVELRDTQIAGIAVARRIPIATRNINHFADLDLKLVNPWGSSV